MPEATNPDWIEGFEHRVASLNQFGAAQGAGIFDVVNRVAGISFVAGRTGGFAIQIVNDGVANTSVEKKLPLTKNRIFSGYFDVTLGAAALHRIMNMISAANVSMLNAHVRLSDGIIRMQPGTGTSVDGPVVTGAGYHKLDVWLDSTGTTWTIKWAVDDVVQTDVTLTGQVATDIEKISLGSQVAAENGTVVWDDVVATVTTEDHPIDSHIVYGAVPNIDGAHSGGSNIVEDQAGTDVGSLTTVWELINEWPDEATDYVRQIGVGTGNYAEVGFQDAAPTDIWGVQAYAALSADSTPINHGVTRILDEFGSQLVDIYVGDMSQTVTHYRSVIVPPPGGAWSSASFNGLKARVGFSADATPAPRWLALMLQYVVADTVVVQSISPSSIVSAQAFGTARINQSIQLSGIASAQAFGVISVGRFIGLTGIPGAAAMGTPSVVSQTMYDDFDVYDDDRSYDEIAATSLVITLDGIGSGFASGSPVITTTDLTTFIVSPGIVSSEAWGTLHIIQNITVEGIATAEVFGFPFVVIGVPPGPEPPIESLWRADIHDLNDPNPRLVGAPFQHWTMKWLLNAPGVVEADMYLKHLDVNYLNLKPGARELRIYREDVLCWGGYIWVARVSRKTQKVRILAEGYFSRLRRRILHEGRTRLDMDTADIAWDIIDWTQDNDGTFGIQDGHSNSGFVVDRYFCMSDKVRVGDAIQELSEMDNSFDFWITPSIKNSNNKMFKTDAPRRGEDLSETIIYDGSSLIDDDYEIDAMELANRLWGEGTGECNPPSFEATANASIGEFGELHDTVEFEDLDHLPSVQAHTREALRNTKKARELPTLVLSEDQYEWRSFDVGDIIGVTRSDGFDTGSRHYRTASIEFDFVPDNRIAFVRVGVDSVTGD